VFLPTSQRTVVCRDLKFNEQRAIRVSLERELKLHGDEELLVPKEKEPPNDVDQPHAKDPVVKTTTPEQSSRDGQKHS